MKTIAVILLSVVLPVFVVSADQIDVCCAWDSSLSDGNLTFKISGGDDTAQATVRAAVYAWETVPGLRVTEVTDKKTKADINIKFKRGGGVIAGLALRKFGKRRSPFVTSVRIIISGKAFGEPSSQATIDEIARHEMGRALGAGHADFDDLMGTTVSGITEISDLDKAAVIAANHWKLVDNSGTPHEPHVDSVGSP